MPQIYPTEKVMAATDVPPLPGWGTMLGRGALMRCPACGGAGIFQGFITVRPSCPRCGAPLGRVRLELLPSYLTILLGLWVMGAVMFLVALHWRAGWGRFIAVFVPACIVFELAVARPVRGMVLAAMLKMGVLREPGAPQDAG